MSKILIVDDSEDLRFALSNIVRKEGYEVATAETGAAALDLFHNQIIDLAFLDIGLPDIDGIELISRLKELDHEIDVVMLTGRNDANSAILSLKAGAIDYILKPFEVIEFRNILNRIMQGRIAAKQDLVEPRGHDTIIGNSRLMLRLKDQINTASEVNAPVLVTGETGTGKELVARAIHALPGDRRGIFVKVDCGTLAATVIESELFGHEKGAFTDARQDKKGLVEMADGGTLFLDEIGNLPLELQPVLLRLIEESTFRRVGGLKDIHVKLRIIAATNVDIKEEVAQGRFREDLFYRLDVIPVAIPPLRDRGDDVLLLADYYLGRFSRELKKKIKGFTPEAERHLLAYDWPGNIRELKNCIEREVIYCRDEWLSVEGLPLARAASGDSALAGPFKTLREYECDYIRKVLDSTGNNKSRAAQILGISRTTLRDKLSHPS